ncbi:dihydrolipoyl dehydrogenase family protein [Terrilactibacillus laevilacticus]|uniref:dihydrolipoyl dehydrogenase family protein n=1 Tax=Terrilactibacillus laevilacticus TaxID=1380157 RepID=UPI0011476FA3|nr:NAD(P)/FAD-dependent oxidoreductase [Terrilactibacillus laevilacticus]
MKKHKVIVIGGGAAGLYTAAGLARFGVDVALIDSASEMGGDCLHTGCVPSKTLLHWASKGLTWDATRRKISETIASLQEHDSDVRFRELGVTLYKGKAVFQDETTIRIDGQMLTADKFVLATGARPVVPAIPGLKSDMYDTHETLFTRPSVPKSMLIIGGGAVGLEIGQALAKMGTDVTLVERHEQFLPAFDRDVAEIAHQRLSQDTTILLRTSVTQVEVHDEGKIKVTLNGDQELIVDRLFIATGRKPDIDALGWDKAGIEITQDHTIKVNAYLQTTNPRVYAAGDCIGGPMLTHAAGEEARTVITNLVFGRLKKMSYRGMAMVVYTDPEIYQLVTIDDQVEQPAYTYTARGSDVDRFVIDNERDANVKITINKKGCILQAQAVGTSASSYMQLVAQAVARKESLSIFSSSHYPYPLKSEILKTLANQYLLHKFESPLVQWLLNRWVRFRKLNGGR